MRRPEPTPEVARARRYAARVRIAVALVGGLILFFNPKTVNDLAPAAIGLTVIGITGIVESLVRHERWLFFEESFSCLAVVFIVAWGGGEVTAITLLWLVAAATGVMARGGRVGGVGRVLVTGALLFPLISEGINGERVGLAFASIALLLATGRISRETASLLKGARFAADHDELTGLLTRSAFRTRVDDLAPRTSLGDPAALIVFDLDYFGAINKRHGNAMGDELLVAVSRAVEVALRPGDLLGRVGGDEFGVFAFSKEPVALAARLIETIAASSEQFAPQARAGYALCPLDGIDAESLLAGADVAMRVAKRSGERSIVVPYQGLQLSNGATGARAALERLCTGEGIAMVAQPIVDIATGKPHAYEALARFSTEDNQGPLQWFALAEEFGMRGELELACLRAAVGLIPDLPGGTRLSVNLSAPLLADSRTLELFARCEDISNLIVEVTEETLVRQGADVEHATQTLRSRGVLFAVDDIGAGYSGLGQLAVLRPAYLKLDRALVTGIDQEPARASLVRVLASYARSTDGLLVAEGVETEAELAEVRAAGVPLVQGFLLARPGPPWPQVPAGEHVDRGMAPAALSSTAG